MKVKRNTLLLLACLVWSLAGINLLRIGLATDPAYHTVLHFLMAGLVFAVFQGCVFTKLVRKHTTRMNAYLEERLFFLKFFDGKAFATMAVMMSGGMILRISGVVPEQFIAVFYTGLGAALLLAGLLFGRNYGRVVRAAAVKQNKNIQRFNAVKRAAEDDHMTEME